MKNQALVSSKDKSKKLKCLLLQFLFGALRVKIESKYLVKLFYFLLLEYGYSYNKQTFLHASNLLT